MSGFDTILVAGWSAGESGPARASKSAIWLGLVREGTASEPRHFRTRVEAEAWIAELIDSERAAGRRLLAGFDFPFGYPAGLARALTGRDEARAVWGWLADRITDTPGGENNRFDVAGELNRALPGGPDRKDGIAFEAFAERRACDRAAGAEPGPFELAAPTAAGSKALVGLPMLARLAARPGVAVWPFDDCSAAPVVLAEISPGLIEPAVAAAMERARAEGADPDPVRASVQVRLLSRALSRLPGDDLRAMMMTGLPPEAAEEGWILGAGHADRLTALAAEAPPPPLANDCFALPPGVNWTPVDEALDRLRRSLNAVTGTERVPLSGADGRILADGVSALRANPPAANSAVDGYGFAHASLGPPPHRLPLVAGRAAAGEPFRGRVPPGHAVRILTGALVPEGVDTVVLEEDCALAPGEVGFASAPRAGANTREAGEDVAAGDNLLPAGHRLRPPDLALLAATGTAEVEVRARLRVAVLSTGDELTEPGHPAPPDRTYDANRPMLLSLAARWGHRAIDLGHARDDRAAVAAALDRAAGEADVLLTSGGASAGDEDHVSALLREAGTLTAWRIALKPGRPLALAMWQGMPVFGLPGNPVAALVCALIFARPALSVLAGGAWTAPLAITVPAAFSKRKKPGRREFLRARLDAEGRAEVFASEGSGRISGLSWAEGLVELPDGALEVAPGDPVRFLPYAGFGF